MKRIKLFTIIIIICFTSSSAFSQIKFGIKSEFGITSPYSKKDGFSIQYKDNFKIGPTVNFSIPIVGLGLDVSALYMNDKLDVTEGDESKVHILKNHYIAIPINLKYKFDFIVAGIFVYAGPYTKIPIATSDDNFFVGKFTKKKTETGLNLGVGVEILNFLGVNLNYGYRFTQNYSSFKDGYENLINNINNNKGNFSIGAFIYF